MNDKKTTIDMEMEGSADVPCSALGRVVAQTLRSNGVWTQYASGAGILQPYKVSENGEQYVDLFPNDDEVQKPNPAAQAPLPKNQHE